MLWYVIIAYLFGGAFIANSVPHFIAGVSGRKFPSPFGKPPGKGLSSPVSNMWWGLANFIAGYLLLTCVGTFTPGFTLDSLVVLLGAALISIQLSSHFGQNKNI